MLISPDAHLLYGTRQPIAVNVVLHPLTELYWIGSATQEKETALHPVETAIWLFDDLSDPLANPLW